MLGAAICWMVHHLFMSVVTTRHSRFMSRLARHERCDRGIFSAWFIRWLSFPSRSFLDRHTEASNEIKHTRVKASKSLQDTLNPMLNDASFVARVVDHDQGAGCYDVCISAVVDTILEQCNETISAQLTGLLGTPNTNNIDERHFRWFAIQNILYGTAFLVFSQADQEISVPLNS